MSSVVDASAAAAASRYVQAGAQIHNMAKAQPCSSPRPPHVSARLHHSFIPPLFPFPSSAVIILPRSPRAPLPQPKETTPANADEYDFLTVADVPLLVETSEEQQPDGTSQCTRRAIDLNPLVDSHANRLFLMVGPCPALFPLPGAPLTIAHLAPLASIHPDRTLLPDAGSCSAVAARAPLAQPDPSHQASLVAGPLCGCQRRGCYCDGQVRPAPAP